MPHKPLKKTLKALQERVAKGLVPLKASIAIHLGQVIYGIVGAASRLDFTVMGHAVNVVARIQQLSGELSVPVLFSHEVAKQLTSASSSLGRYQLKGSDQKLKFFNSPLGTMKPPKNNYRGQTSWFDSAWL